MSISKNLGNILVNQISNTNSIGNISLTNITTSNIISTTASIDSIISTNNTLTNLILTSGSIGSLSTGNISVSGNITVGGNLLVQGTLISVNVTSVNVINSNITTSSLNSANITSTNIVGTNISAGSLNLTTLNISSITTGALLASTQVSSGNIYSTNITSTNIVGTNISAGSLNLSSLNISTITTSSLLATNSSLSNIYNNSITTSSLLAIGNSNTIGNIYTTGGNVGINTNSPNVLLSLSTYSSNQKLAIYDGISNFYGFGANDSLLHLHSGTSTGAVGQIVINNYGFMGINTINPQFSLDVNGTTRITTSLTTGAVYSTNITSTNLVSNVATISNLVYSTLTVGNMLSNNLNLGTTSMFSGSFSASNNQSSAANVTGLIFDYNNISYFEIILTINITTSTPSTLNAVYTIRGNYSSGWAIADSYIGDTTGITFSINSSTGQILYTSTNISLWTSDIFRYRVEQITSTGTYTSLIAGATTSNYSFNTLQILSTTDALPNNNIGALQIAGGVTIAKELFVGGRSFFNTIGSLGINNTNPTVQLDFGTSNVNQIIGLYNNSQFYGLGAASGNLNYLSNQNHAFYTGSTFGQSTAALGSLKFLIASSGNVGINNTNPAYNLDVNGNVNFTTFITTNNVYSTNITSTNIVTTNISSSTLYLNSLSMDTGTNGNLFTSTFNTRNWSITNPTTSSTSLPIVFNTNNAWDFQTDAASRIYIADINNIGINNTSPSYSLDISGSTRITTRLDIGGTQPSFNGGTIGRLFITGPSSASNGGPHLLMNTTQDQYPTVHWLNFTHDNLALNLDCYYDGTFRTSGINTAFQMYKQSNQLKFTFATGSAGSTKTFTNALVIGSTGNVAIAGALSKGSGTFDIQHPILPTKRLVHSFIEGPRCDLIYRGSVQLSQGNALVNIDSDCTFNTIGNMTQGTFEALTINPVCYLQNNISFDRVRGTINTNILQIICENNSSNDIIDWMVIAERNDQFIKQWERTDSQGFLVTEYIPNTPTNNTM